MTAKRQLALEIPISSLNLGEHYLDFQLSDEFFEQFGGLIVKEGNLKVSVKVDLSSALITLSITVRGLVTQVCDRSLDDYEESVDTFGQIRFKYGEVAEELSEDLYVILPNTPSIEISQVVYDFICLSLPLKKLHPRFREHLAGTEDTEDEESMLIYSTLTEEASSSVIDTTEPDSRWSKLLDIKEQLKGNHNLDSPSA